jgi:uncharacterized protein YwbE
MDLTKRENIQEGMYVIIKEFPDQLECDYVEGMVKGVLPGENIIQDGIRVVLHTGSIGNVKDLVGPRNSIDMIKKRLLDRENESVERKSTFSYDLVLSKENKYLQTVASIAAVSLLNSNGGFLYIGVLDDGTPLGLDLDYSLMAKEPNNDGLERRIRERFSQILDETVALQKNLVFDFPIIDGKEICEIHIKPSEKPIFLKTKKCTVVIDQDHKPQRNIDDFYIRTGNGHFLVQTHAEFYDYALKRFTAY